MATKSIEERLAKLELEVKRSQAVAQCQNQVSRYSFLHTAGLHRECVDLFTSHTPDAKVEMTWGVYEGMDAAYRCYAVDHINMEGEGEARKGALHLHALTTPIIEVSADGETAKGVWISPGIESGSNEASWCWIKYAADFIQEDGKWKIWHFHVYDIFTCPYDKSWIEVNTNIDFTKEENRNAGMGSITKPDRGPTTQWSYSPDAIYPADKPWVPMPYEAWDDSLSYVK